MPRARAVATGAFVELGSFEAPPLRARRARAYVPKTPAGRRRPALVLFDGQNVFGDEGSYAGGWHAHGAVDRIAARGPIVAPIIVAVDHGGEERIDELAPWSDGKRGGKLDALLDLVTKEILPAARAKLPLLEIPAIIGGSSMGGLAAVYAHLTRPGDFRGALAMSPSLWFARGRALEEATRGRLPERSRFYLDAGAREVKGALLSTCQALAGVLRARGWADGGPRVAGGARGDRVLWFRPDPKGTHAEAHWRRRLPAALRFLFA